MPAGPRIRGNNSYGITTDNPLTIGATTFNSPGLATLPIVASAHAVVTLDPLRQFGEPEIVVVTAHTSLSTVATITRGQYGTVARSHPQGTVWVHAPIDEDVIEVLTSGTRPGNPYEGQFIFETDTNKLVGFDAVGWAPRDAGGQVAYAERKTNQTGIGSTLTDLTGLTVTFTALSTRLYKISAQLLAQQSGATGTSTCRLTTAAGGAANEIQRIGHDLMAASQATIWSGSVRLTGLSGPQTFKLQASTSAGTFDLIASAMIPAFIMVEDIGAA